MLGNTLGSKVACYHSRNNARARIDTMDVGQRTAVLGGEKRFATHVYERGRTREETKRAREIISDDAAVPLHSWPMTALVTSRVHLAPPV